MSSKEAAGASGRRLSWNLEGITFTYSAIATAASPTTLRPTLTGVRSSKHCQVLQGSRRGFRQLLPRRDQGNLLDSINFWIAGLVALLTVVSFVSGLVAIIYTRMSYDVSRKSWELTRDQYLLSLAEACSDPESIDAVLETCRAKNIRTYR